MTKKIITVVGGTCQDGVHQIGDSWEFEWLTPEGICLGAWGAVTPYIMRERPKSERVHCPDPKGIILEIERKVEDTHS